MYFSKTLQGPDKTENLRSPKYYFQFKYLNYSPGKLLPVLVYCRFAGPQTPKNAKQKTA